MTTTPATLLDLTREFDELEHELLACGGEVDEALTARFTALVVDLSAKADSVGWYMHGLEGRAEKLRELARRAEAQARALENHYERMLGYLDYSLGERQKLAGEAFTISRRKNPPAVEITDLVALKETCPHVFHQPEPPPETIDKAALKVALQASEHIRGAVLTQGHRIAITP